MKPLKYDVLVAGGGPAGIAAASAAGRLGARVVLLEHYGFLGGLATAGMAGTVCGLYLRDTRDSRPTLVEAGFPAEFSAQLMKASGSRPVRLEHGLWVLPCAPWAFERAADRVLSEAGDVTTILHATLTDVAAESGHVASVRFFCWNESFTALPKAVVDCTGEATLAALAGGSVEDGSADQTPAVIFVIEGVAPDFNDDEMLPLLLGLRLAVEGGRLSAGCEQLSLVPGSTQHGRVSFKLNLPRIKPDAPLCRRLTDCERTGRALAHEVYRFLVEEQAAFRQARYSHTATQVGVRAGRRIRGSATLRDEAVLSARKVADGIARGGWPMERWGEGPQPKLDFFEERDYYEIPSGCLRAAGLENVVAGGRCLSAEAGALASARVIGTTLATGWAAGTMAAFQALGWPLSEAVAQLQRQQNR